MTEVSAEEMATRVGSEWLSDWMTLDQARIDAFADATDDRQFIHTDPQAAAAATPFGGTIAHGFLLLSLMPKLAAGSGLPAVTGTRMEVNYGGERVRFVRPVRSGSRIRGRFTLIAFAEKQPGRWQRTTRFTVEVDGQDQPALIADWISQIFL